MWQKGCGCVLFFTTGFLSIRSSPGTRWEAMFSTRGGFIETCVGDAFSKHPVAEHPCASWVCFRTSGSTKTSLLFPPPQSFPLQSWCSKKHINRYQPNSICLGWKGASLMSWLLLIHKFVFLYRFDMLVGSRGGKVGNVSIFSSFSKFEIVEIWGKSCSSVEREGR